MKLSVKFLTLLWIALIPVAGWSQTTLSFPLPIDSSIGSYVGYAVLNPGSTTAVVLFNAFDENGQLTGFSSVSIGPTSQVSKLFSELFSASTSGWVQLTSNTSGLRAFMVGGYPGISMDGVANAEPGEDQVFPLVANSTAVSAVNTGAAEVDLTMHFFTAFGVEIEPAITTTLQPRGLLYRQVRDNSRRGLPYADASYIRLTAPRAFAATAVVSSFLGAGPEFALYNAVDVSKAGSVLNFPHVVSGEVGATGYKTALALTNLTSLYQTAAITLTPANGFTPTTVRLTLQPSANATNVLEFPAGFKNGWIQVIASGPVAGVMAIANTDATSAGIAVVEPQASTTSMFFAHIADLAPWVTGLAFSNPTALTATVEVFAMNPNGTLIGGAANVPTARFTLDPGAKSARLLSELIPQTQMRTSDGGFIFVRTNNVPIIGLELFTLRRGGATANVPPSSVPAGVTFTPPTP